VTSPAVPHTAVGVVGIVHGDAGLLLTLSRDRGWEPPGGFIDPGEAVIPAMHREVLEETGWEVEAQRLTGVYHCIREVPILSLVFSCVAQREVDAAGDESLGTTWASPADIPALVRYPPHLLRIGDALAAEPGVYLRTYALAPFRVMTTQMC
jgi:ADP-ribose pyrophosphatase YjhB (NUDIX family)